MELDRQWNKAAKWLRSLPACAKLLHGFDIMHHILGVDNVAPGMVLSVHNGDSKWCLSLHECTLYLHQGLTNVGIASSGPGFVCACQDYISALYEHGMDVLIAHAVLTVLQIGAQPTLAKRNHSTILPALMMHCI